MFPIVFKNVEFKSMLDHPVAFCQIMKFKQTYLAVLSTNVHCSPPAIFDESVGIRPVLLIGKQQLERSEVAGRGCEVDGALSELGIKGLGVCAGLQKNLQKGGELR